MARLIRTHWIATLWSLGIVGVVVAWYVIASLGVFAEDQAPGAPGPAPAGNSGGEGVIDEVDASEHSQLMALREVLGLTARDLAAMECDAERAREVVSALHTWHRTNRSSLDEADAGVIRAGSQLQEIYRQMNIGPAEPGAAASLSVAKASLAAARAQRESLYGSAVSAVESKLTSEQTQLWGTIRENIAQGVPDVVRYVGSVTQEQAKQLSLGRSSPAQVLSGPQLASLGASREQVNESLDAVATAEATYFEMTNPETPPVPPVPPVPPETP